MQAKKAKPASPRDCLFLQAVRTSFSSLVNRQRGLLGCLCCVPVAFGDVLLALVAMGSWGLGGLLGAPHRLLCEQTLPPFFFWAEGGVCGNSVAGCLVFLVVIG